MPPTAVLTFLPEKYLSIRIFSPQQVLVIQIKILYQVIASDCEESFKIPIIPSHWWRIAHSSNFQSSGFHRIFLKSQRQGLSFTCLYISVLELSDFLSFYFV